MTSLCTAVVDDGPDLLELVDNGKQVRF